MVAHPDDLGLQQAYPRIEFVQRIAFQAFAGEEAGGAEVSFGGTQRRSIIIVHCGAASDSKPLLSMGRARGKKVCSPSPSGVATLQPC